MPQDSMIEGVNDSKKVSEKKREKLYDLILEEAISYSVAIIGQDIIDEINILNDWFRYNNFGIEYFYAPYDGWQECATPNLTEVLNGSFEVIKCRPKIYSHETEILRR